ncbi:uncharacterized protein EKO05_0010106 [Ascochyta rabiei]|uniref:uncharacterized protein n=1 Tax=Didymella rabiei TaxID=5454 RepID=UPI002201AFC4|nr:uncharacterized protein EKO05_0010106 [Ascochyta rabiei]UPX19855.1 hypothetical protein EKO05_0010106 [Ascochyta rabiei]
MVIGCVTPTTTEGAQVTRGSFFRPTTQVVRNTHTHMTNLSHVITAQQRVELILPSKRASSGADQHASPSFSRKRAERKFRHSKAQGRSWWAAPCWWLSQPSQSIDTAQIRLSGVIVGASIFLVRTL